jgi:hypothetical protein
MHFKPIENSSKYFWTEHAKMKMRQYGLSVQRIKRVIRQPLRTEKGIAERTIAVMQPQSFRRNEKGEKDWKSEIWVMYQTKKDNLKSDFSATKMNANLQKMLGNLESEQMKIISVWRYPGKTKEGESLPEYILDEMAECEG